MRVSLRLTVSEGVDSTIHASCVNLKEAFVEGENLGVVLSKMQTLVTEKVQAYIRANEKVPWERPQKRSPLGEDGSNQTLWVDLELDEDNLPPGNVIVTCLSCGKKLKCEDVQDDNVPTIVHDGVICQSRGNYGSAQFDLDGGELIFYLCDNCLIQKAEIIRHVHWITPPKVVRKVQTFKESRNG